MLQSKGDAVISLVSDLQDPPELIKELVAKWEEGFKVVVAIKENSEESPALLRRAQGLLQPCRAPGGNRAEQERDRFRTL